MGHKTGEEVLAYCGQCKMDLIAVIVAMEGAKIARVMCKTCKGSRTYRPAKGVKDPGAQATIVAKRRAVKTEEREIKTVSVHTEWASQMSYLAQSPRVAYSPKTTFKEGDVMAHPTFGEGIVRKTIHPNKVEILFRDDIKTLIHAKT